MSDDHAGGSSLVTKTMPRRAAAKRASKLAAQQLESSPIPSDAEQGGIPTFGEPFTPRSAVRVTYGGKRKYKHTPTGSLGGPSGTRARALSLTAPSPSKPATNGDGRGRDAGRGRGRNGTQSEHAKPHSRSSIENDSTTLSDSDVVTIEDPELVRPSRRNTVTGATGSKSRDLRSSVNKGSAVAGKGPRKRPLSPSSSSDGEGSSLTSLSSPEVRKRPAFPPTSNIAPRLARQFLRTQSQADPCVVSDFKHKSITQSKSLDNLFAPLDSTDDESFDEADSGGLVWVSIDLDGNLADCGDGDGEDTLWWPAKVELPKPLMRVSLFGQPPGHIGAAGEQRLDITSPSLSTVRSMSLDGRMRFNENNYRPSRADSQQASPRKKRKLDVDSAWKEARDLVAKENDADDLPFGPSRYVPGPSSSRKGGKGKMKDKGKGKEVSSEEDTDDDGDLELEPTPRRTWRAPSANPLLELPGELVLAKEGKVRTQYWPAKLLEYVKPTKPAQRPKYKVLFFDGTISHVEPDWFWTTTDEEFATCNLGESTGNYGLDHDNDALDEAEGAEDFNRPFAPEDKETLRSQSPLPPLPAPGPEVFEYDMTMPEAFEYIKPVLAAVLDNEYGPAKAQNEGFMRGGGARRKVLDAVPLRGSLSARDKEEVAFLVRCWARRRDRRRGLGLSVDYPLDKLYPSEDARAEMGPSDDDDADSVLTPTSDLSVGDTELLPLSDAEAPSSSFVSTEMETDDEKASSIPEDVPEHARAVPEDAIYVNSAAELPSASENVHSQDIDQVKTAQEGEKEAVNGKNDGSALAHPRMTFHDLDPVEKITYCNNVLLQEAILQLLLWRTGQRKALGLLSPEEEQHLHDIALAEGEKTNWVHDIIRLRQAVEKTMLPTNKSKAKGGGPAAGAAIGTRARTRRGA